MNNLWLTLGVPVASSLLTSFLTVRLALGRFYQEKWWERRLNAYLEVIEALHTISKIGSEWADQEIMRYVKSEDDRKDEQLIFKKARNDLRRSVAIGELMLSEQAVNEISACQSYLDRINIEDLSPLEYFEEITHTAASALVEMRTLVKRDLSLKGPLRRLWRPRSK